MTWLDYSILAILGISVLYSFARGVVREVFSLLALIVGYMVASRVYGYGAPYLDWAVTDPRLAGIISFVAIFLTITLLVGAVGRMVHAAAKKVKLSLANRTLGAIFGFGKGVVLVSVLLLLIPVLSKSAAQGRLLKDSMLSPFFDVATEALSSVFPTKRYGVLDNRLTEELREVRRRRGGNIWSALSRWIQRKRSAGSGDPGQTDEDERAMQKLLKQ